MAVNRRSILNALTEGNQLFGLLELDGLNDVIALFLRCGVYGIAELAEHRRSQRGALYSLHDNVRGEEQALIETIVTAKIGTDFTSDAGRGQAIRAFFNQILASGNVPARRS